MSHDHHQSAQIRSEPVPPCYYTTGTETGTRVPVPSTIQNIGQEMAQQRSL